MQLVGGVQEGGARQHHAPRRALPLLHLLLHKDDRCSSTGSCAATFRRQHAARGMYCLSSASTPQMHYLITSHGHMVKVVLGLVFVQ